MSMLTVVPRVKDAIECSSLCSRTSLDIRIDTFLDVVNSFCIVLHSNSMCGLWLVLRREWLWLGAYVFGEVNSNRRRCLTRFPPSFEQEVFPSAGCVVSLVDRLVHRSEVIAIEGKSYRLKGRCRVRVFSGRSWVALHRQHRVTLADPLASNRLLRIKIRRRTITEASLTGM
jgi:hypothetical protein